jgi:hypothetical protein
MSGALLAAVPIAVEGIAGMAADKPPAPTSSSQPRSLLRLTVVRQLTRS